MKPLHFIFLFFALSVSGVTYSQAGTNYEFYEFSPYRVDGNPAMRPLAKVNFAMPILGGVHTSFQSDMFYPKVGLKGESDGRTVVDVGALLDRMGDASESSFEMTLNLFHLGLRLGKGYVHLGIKERARMDIHFPTDLFYLAAYGNVGTHEFENGTIDFSSLSGNMIYYREFSLGYSREIGEKWSVGATAKYLYGMVNLHTENSGLSLRTDPETYALQTSGSFNVHTSGLGLSDDHEDFDALSLLSGLKNRGAAFDLGVVYRPINKLNLSLSAHDIGWITWKDDVASYRTKDASFLYDGLDLSDFLFVGESFSDSIAEEIDRWEDELDEHFRVESDENSYTSRLKGYLRLGGSYELWRANSLSGHATVNFVRGFDADYIPFRFSAGYIQRLGRILELGVNVGKRGEADWGLGGGMVLNIGFLQVFAMADNLNFLRMTEVNYYSDSGDHKQYRTPSKLDDLRFSAGMTFTFGRKDKEKTDSKSIETAE